MFLKSVIGVVGAIVIGTVAAKADVIMPDYHVVDRCVSIHNLDAFPDLAFVGGYRMGSAALQCYEVRQDSCLTKGYKFNSFYLFWVEKKYLDSVGIDKVPLADLLPQISAKKQFTVKTTSARYGLVDVNIDPYGGTVPDSNPVVSEQFHSVIIADWEGNLFAMRPYSKIATDKNGQTTTEMLMDVGVHSGRMRNATVGTFTAAATLTREHMLFTSSESGVTVAELIDCRGMLIARVRRTCSAGRTYVENIPGLSAGIYWLRVKNGRNQVTVPVTRFGR